MSQYRCNMAFETPRSPNSGCCGCCCGNSRDDCYMQLGTVIDDCNLARNCSCNYRCCICGGWCGADCICTRCGNPCIDNCDRCDEQMGCGCGCGCGCGGRRDCGCAGNDVCGCRRRGLICLHKVAANNTALALAGAEFELQKLDGTVLNTGTTDANGDLCFHNLRNGTYVLRETAAPAGYQLNPSYVTVELTPCDHREFLEITNTPIAGMVSILAADAANPAITFPGITVRLNNLAMQTIATAITDANGIAAFANVPFGTYTAIPVNSPAGYTLPGIPTTVTVSAATPSPSATIGFMPLV